jgi:stalled ribosome rescue protein Dom34
MFFLTTRVKNGAYHTIVLELNKSFTLTKAFWDEVALLRLEEACNVQNRAEVHRYLSETKLLGGCLVDNGRSCQLVPDDRVYDGNSCAI